MANEQGTTTEASEATTTDVSTQAAVDTEAQAASTESDTKAISKAEYDRLVGAANFERQQRERMEADYKKKQEDAERERLEEQNKFQELYEKERVKRENFERDLKQREQDSQLRELAAKEGAPEFAELLISAREAKPESFGELVQQFKGMMNKAVAGDVEKRLDTGERVADPAASSAVEPATWQELNSMPKAEILKRREARIKATS